MGHSPSIRSQQSRSTFSRCIPTTVWYPALALRIDRWDESKLLINRRVYFQFQASLVGKDGQQLWYGTLSGEVKLLEPGPFGYLAIDGIRHTVE